MSTKPVSDVLLQQTDRLTRRARLLLFWERYAPVFALAALILSLFLVGAFSGLWDYLGDPWRLIALIFAVYFLTRAVLSARKVKYPSPSEAARRVEDDNNVAHRPLDVLRDKAVLAETLWDEHVQKARKIALTLKPAKAVKVITPIDRCFLRFRAPAALVLAMMVGVGDNMERLRRALTPDWQAGMRSDAVSFDAWVDPPDYTGRPPIYFKDKRKVEIPAGSELVARISGLKDAPRLKLSGHGRTRYLGLDRLGPQSFEARTTLTKSAKAEWRIGARQKVWDLTVLPDTPPMVILETDPKADKRDRLVLTYSLKDDFGVTALSLKMTHMDDPNGPTESVAITLPSRSVRTANKTDIALDLTKHVWTGRKVSGVLVATDGLGQTAQSDVAYFTIPDKIFIEPLAKAITEQRGLVMSAMDKTYAPLPKRTRKDWANMPYFDSYQTDVKLGRAPATVQRAALLIEALTDEPVGLFQDPAVFMGLKNILGRMRYARDMEGLAGIPEDLWNMALRAEFGRLGTALENMRRSEQALNDGIARRAPEREIDILFDRYNEAVDIYMEELRRKAIAEGNVADSDGGSGGGNSTNQDEIEALLKAIEEANAQGDTEGARRALKRLAELLENMQVQLAQGGSGSGGGDPSQGDMSEEEKEALEDLADLLGEQRALKDETEQAQRQQDRNEQNAQNGSGSAGSQADNQSEARNGGAPKSAEELAEQQAQLEALLEKLEDGFPMALSENLTGGTDARNPDSDNTSNGGNEESDNSAEDGQGGGASDPNAQDSDDGSGTSGSDDEPRRSASEALEAANEAMRAAKEALSGEDLASAREAQNDAIQALRDAAQSLVAQARERAGDRDSNQSAQGEGNPLGQNNQGENDDFSETDIDQRDNATRSRELLEELRRRAAEQERDEEELNYLERLLKRF